MIEQQASMYGVIVCVSLIQLILFHLFFIHYGTPQQDSLCDKRWKIVYFIIPIMIILVVLVAVGFILEIVFKGIKESFQGIKRYFGLS